MTLDAASHRGSLVDIAASAQEIIDDLVEHPWGGSSPSVYETGRLVSLAPWLTGHAERLRFLLAEQRPDGGWGLPHDGYALIPTLSATEALLSALSTEPGGAARPAPGMLVPGLPVADVGRAAGRGLRLLSGWLAPGHALDLPDMPAIEHIAPYLIERINAHLDAPAIRSIPGLESWRDRGRRLRAPAGVTGELLPVVRELLEQGHPVPVKLLHALEIAGDSAHGARSVRPEPSGTVGASPAATATWLGRDPGPPGTGDRGGARMGAAPHVAPHAAPHVGPAASPDADPTVGPVAALAHGGDSGPAAHATQSDRAAARRYLEAAVVRHGGPVPVATPITAFERGWVLSWLARAGVPLEVPRRLITELRATLGPSGTGGGEGLPPDADSSAGVLYALSLLGHPYPPDLLWQYELDTHFCTWQGENGRSITTNAHVLEAFGHFMASTGGGESAHRYSATVTKLTSWLCEQQDADGSWRDRWHASPYYATSCAALAIDGFGSAPGSARAVERAVRWVIDSQRADGSWGRWDGTVEETAYAVQLLLLVRSGSGEGMRAASRGGAFLRSALVAEGVPAPGQEIGLIPTNYKKVPLWHDKDTYFPDAIVRAITLGALRLLQEKPSATFV
ncbi:prenyltransferase/squalene oxidase repeat-containing protein [Spirillospora sp. CA-255316]